MPTTTTMTPMFPTRNDLLRNSREATIGLLNQQLADTFDLLSQAKQAHWNVKGPEFLALHDLFDKLAAELAEYVDMIAERATALGGVALGTVRMSASSSRLPECNLDATDGVSVVDDLSDRFALLGASMRKAIEVAENHGDPGTADLFTEVSRGIDKSLWFLEAHLQ
jgi:starvation-inducible DNA-binding protein